MSYGKQLVETIIQDLAHRGLEPALAQARVVISDWKHDYNHHRHSSLGYLSPARYASQCQLKVAPGWGGANWLQCFWRLAARLPITTF